MIDRVITKGVPCVVGYHTQEFRYDQQPLKNPMKCISNEAWLGFGYYFWLEKEFTHSWGKLCKNRTGAYDVYQGNIKEMGILNTTFSEDAYFFFRESIETVIASFKKDGLKINLQTVHRYLVDKFWPNANVTGIIYDDLPWNSARATHTLIPPLHYKKRIQLVVFNLNNIISFELSSEANNC
jgi:hypothetical protein